MPTAPLSSCMLSSVPEPLAAAPGRPFSTVFAALVAVCGLVACEAPVAPAVCGALPQQMITVGESTTVTACFDDPDGNTLTYKVWSSDPGVVKVTGAGATVTVTAVSPGSALVTILADNRHGMKAQQSMTVLVPNRPPLAISEIGDREVIVGDSVTVDVSGYFDEPDGQGLTYTVAADSSVLNASVEGTVLTVVAMAKGTVTVTLTATDPGGMEAVQSFLVMVPNQPPLVEGSVPAQTIEVADSAMVDVSPLFVDPDGDALSYSVVASDTRVAAAKMVESMISVMAIAKGEAMVTVTATDTEGLTAAQSFAVMVPNQPPLVTESIPAQVVEVGNTDDLDMTPLFSDPDGDALTYTAVSANSDVVEVSVVGTSVRVAAIGKGETTVTVTATDTEGLAIAQDFVVTVPNQTPLAVGSIPAQSVHVESVVNVDATPYFSDPDGDWLVYAAATSDSKVATATATGSTVIITAVSKGEATVTVTVTDTDGLVATQAFPVTVPNRTPLATTEFEAHRVKERQSETLDLAAYFSDPDGDPLIFEAVSSEPAVVTATVTDGKLRFRGRKPGTATITVTARDDEGLSVTQEFVVTITRSRRNRPPLVTGSAPAPSIPPGEQFSTDLDRHFDDPDDDPLTFDATSSNTRVVTARISNKMLMLNAVDEGTANVKVTASDPQGDKASMQFRVVVDRSGGGNGSAPTVSARIPDQYVAPNSDFSADLRDHFSDPDRETLSYEATTGNEDIARASVSGYTLTVTGVANGTTSVTVTASDPGNRSATLTFTLTVETRGTGNRRPTVSDVIAFRQLDKNDTFETDLDDHFSDPDNDDLTYSATSSRPAKATVDVSGSTMTVTARAKGTTTITVTAEDGSGATATLDFEVTIRQPGQPNRAPSVTETPPDRFLVRRAAQPVQGWRYFEDPDGDDLTYTGASSNSAVASIDQQSDIYFEVYAKSNGQATITITAEDPDGETAEASFLFEVGNRSPQVDNAVPSTIISSPGQVDSLTMNWHFEDPDGGDELTLTTSSSNTSVARATTEASGLYGWYARIVGKQTGQATVTLTVTDLGGLSTSQSVVVTVDSNRPPRITQTFDGILEVEVGETLTKILSEYFSDPDGDELSYSAQVGVFASVAVSGDTLRIIGVRSGISPGRVFAEDPGGKTNNFSWLVYVKPAASSSQDAGPDWGSAGSLSMGPLSAPPPSSESPPRADPPAGALPPWAPALLRASLPPGPQ